jgi:hypothetical protein
MTAAGPGCSPIAWNVLELGVFDARLGTDWRLGPALHFAYRFPTGVNML